MPDPRSTEGELMCPVLYPAWRVAELKRELLRDYRPSFSRIQPARRARIFTATGCRCEK